MEHHLEHLTDAPARDRFPTDPTGLREATASPVVELDDGDTTELDVSPVAADLGGTTVRMLAYNGSLPGPTLAVRQGTAVVVRVTNHGDLETTVHWHGLRLQNRYDGVPVDTQDPIPIGGEFRYRLEFPDPGLYWYHPHVREDYTQELGLYGNILVSPADPGYWSPVDAELVLTVDDLLLEEGRVAPFSRVETSHAAMGRYGDVFLVGGRVSPRLHARAGEVTRLWLTNTANTRVFNLAVPGARMKLVGGDSGRVERQQWVTEVMLAPSERVVVDLLVDAPGEHPLQHRPPGTTRTLAVLDVADPPAEPSAAAAAFAELRTAPELVRERERLPLAASPDKVLAFVATIDPAGPGRSGRGAHADHGAHSGHGGPAAPPAHAHHGSARPERDDLAGIEWEDEMAEANRALTSARVHWRVVDRTGGVDHDDIDWQLTVGDRVKIRLVNEAVSDHPMHHPFHVHGAGRFLVVARDGVEEPNLVWKDTVLVRAGEIVDIVLHVTRPGRWMAHCHIAEHLQSGMAFGFTVVSAGSGPTG